MDRQRKAYPRPAMCAALAVSLSGYQVWKLGGTPKRKQLAQIRAIHTEFKGAYGSPRKAVEIWGRDFPASKERVERLTREANIRARHNRHFNATTNSKKHSLPAAPNRVWTADLTEIWPAEGWLYLAVVLNLLNGENVGWSLKLRMTVDIVIDALTMAWFRRKSAPGQIHQSDRGSHSIPATTFRRLKEYGMVCSMRRKGNCWAIASTECFFNSFKNKRVHSTRYKTREAAIANAFDYIEPFYNRRRSHSKLGYSSPQNFLANWIRSQHKNEWAA